MRLNIHITGRGMVGSGGASAIENWKTLCSGKHNFTKMGPVYGSKLNARTEAVITSMREDKLLKLIDRVGLMGIVSARQAAEALDAKALESTLVIMGSSRGSLQAIEEAIRSYDKTGTVDRFMALSSHIGCLSSAISYHLGCKSSSMTIGSACISGVQAIGLGATLLQTGHGNTAIVGGLEAALTQFTVDQVNTLGILTPLTEDDYPCKSFHPDRSGTVFAEGAATLLLETSPTRPSMGVIRSFYATIESGMKPGHSEHAQSLHVAALKALEFAGLKPEDVDLIVGHGSGTRVGDEAEQACYRAIFGSKWPTIALNKWSLGHLVGGAGAINAVMATFHMEEGYVPAHPYFKNDSPLAREHKKPINRVLVTALGLGGAAAALVIEKP